MVGVALAAVVVGPSPARAASADEARLAALSNTLRASVGAPALAVDESLSTIARSWAATMAAGGTISHNPSLGTDVRGWTKIAENVGMGADLETVHRALVASRPHYVNLTDPELTLVGFGVVTRGGTVFVVEDFSRPSGAAVTPKVAPATTAPPATTPARPSPTTTVPTPRARVTPPTTVAAPPPPSNIVPAPAPSDIAPAPAPSDSSLSPSLALGLEVTRGFQRAVQ